jgi:hypothetical protein
MVNQKDRVLETLSDPDLIQQGDLGTLLATRLYAQSPLARKHLALVYKELNGTDGFVLTAYYTSVPSKRRAIVWKRLKS